MGLSRMSIGTQRTLGDEVEAAVQLYGTDSQVRITYNSYGLNVGYRCVWASLPRKGVVVRKDNVRQLLLIQDREGVENFGVEFIEWNQIMFSTSMDLINSNPTGSIVTAASTDIQGE